MAYRYSLGHTVTINLFTKSKHAGLQMVNTLPLFYKTVEVLTVSFCTITFYSGYLGSNMRSLHHSEPGTGTSCGSRCGTAHSRLPYSVVSLDSLLQFFSKGKINELLFQHQYLFIFF